jgi:hypothetical protein
VVIGLEAYLMVFLVISGDFYGGSLTQQPKQVQGASSPLKARSSG